MTAQVIYPFAVWESGTLNNSVPANDNSLRSQVKDVKALGIANSVPGSPSENDQWIVGTTWGGFTTDNIVVYKGGTWLEFEPFDGQFKQIGSDVFIYDGGWSVAISGRSANTVTAVTSSSGTLTLDYDDGDYFTVALNENITTLTISNMPGSGTGVTLALKITQDSTPRTFSWPASFKWSGGAPSISTGSGDVDLLVVTSFDNGTTWQANLAKDYA